MSLLQAKIMNQPAVTKTFTRGVPQTAPLSTQASSTLQSTETSNASCCAWQQDR